jgi:hypothetical protein
VTQRTMQSPSSTAQQRTAPQMPRIPGITDKPTPKSAGFQLKPLIAVILAAFLAASGFAFWLSHRRKADRQASAMTEASSSGPTSYASEQAKSYADPNAIATLDELAKPWSSKRFTFVDPQNHNSVAAMIIHLPASGASESFWAFSLNTPFSHCQLQYVTDLSALSQRFAFPAAHPMVVSECDGVIYDPLKIATLSNGAWVRGDMVRGGGIRPPLNIQVEKQGNDLVAKRME